MKVRNTVLCGVFAALLCLCAWISVPAGDLSFTLQTFGVFLTLGLLGGRLGTVSILIYLLLGVVGLPVFSGFRGGIGALLSPTGGYLLGFLALALVFWLAEKYAPLWVAMLFGLLFCYLLGTVWLSAVYLDGSRIGFAAAAAKCVLPFLIPDGLKLGLALLLTGKLKRFVY